MSRQILAAMAIAAALTGTAFAQTVVINPEQETVIREYVTTHRIEPVEVTGVEVAVGAVLPETVQLHPIEAPDIQYSYVVVDDRTLVVEPDTRKVIHILQ